MRWRFYSDANLMFIQIRKNLRSSGNDIFMERVSLSYILVRRMGLVFFLRLESSPFMYFFWIFMGGEDSSHI